MALSGWLARRLTGLSGMWYTRSEAQRRYTFFFSSTSLAGAFGGLLASGIGKSKLHTSEGLLF